jgi:hypothetical protein
MLPMTKQFNVELPAAQAKKIKLDAVASDVTLNEYSRIAFIWFLDLPDGKRRAILDSEKRTQKSYEHGR